MKKEYHFLKCTHLLKTVLSCIVFCFAFAVQNLQAEGLAGVGSFGDITSSGYVDIVIPVYDCDGDDEAVYRGKVYVKIDGNPYELIEWDSQQGYDEWQNDDGNHSHWARFRLYNTNNNVVKVFVTSGSNYEVSKTGNWSGKIYGNTHESGSVSHTVRIYLSENLLQNHMNKDVELYTNVDIDENDDGKDGGISGGKSSRTKMPSWNNPTINNPVLSNTPGMYDVTWNVSNAPSGSQYNWDGSAWTIGTASTVSFSISDVQQTKKLNYRYRISEYQWINVSSEVTLPAYQQPKNLVAEDFSAADNSNADTRISWTVSGSQANQQTGDEFELQRSTDAGFASSITVGRVSYNPAQTAYFLLDKTSVDNINGTVYYRIRRTKTSASWNWSVLAETSINKTMLHTGIAARSVTESIDANNFVTVSWDFDDGNVWSENSKIVIKRVRLDNQQTELIELDYNYNSPTKTYREELTAMCKEYHYSVYIKPGNAKYTVQEPVEALSQNQIVPVNFGQITAITTSKGYFSDRVELEWNLVEGAAETFSIQRREYGSTGDFLQLDTKPAFESANKYTFVDETGIPGVIYEYRIAGMTSCAIGLSTVYSPVSIGFRTPTGDFYGRVTFENGQAEEGVEINVTTEEKIASNALEFAVGDVAAIDSLSLLQSNNTAATLQAWVAPSAIGTQKIISKAGMYELGIDNQKFYFKAGENAVRADAVDISTSTYTHLTGVYTGDTVQIYINGGLIAEAIATEAVTGNSNPVQLGGGNYEGYIDEVRLWEIALDSAEINRDYNRYLVGNENGLLAYYTFNYATEKEFFDISYRGSAYNSNHGQLGTASLSSTSVPTGSQLGYKGVTRADGSYEVRAVPYTGNGTAYYLMPKLGIHQFESEREVRFISEQAQSHTVNFIDKSSFPVSGYITYSNSNIPVEGVSFNVDGITVMHNGMPVLSANDGRFDINVPIGVHEVKTVKVGHVFENDGRITDQRGVDLNYQDAISGLELKDSTTIKYIGRVAGGTVQEAFPLGHSLSKNNLSEGIIVTLTYPNQAYHFGKGERNNESYTITEMHFKPSNAAKAHTNEVEYKENTVIINVNDTTGEFVAHIIPEQFNVTVNAGIYHTDIPGNGSTINLTQQFNKQEVPYIYTDSVDVDGKKAKVSFNDTVFYNFSQKFIKRYAPEIKVSQTFDGNELTYFGNDSVVMTNLLGETTTAPVYNKNNNIYTFGKPVFETNERYDLIMKVFERYDYYAQNGDILSTDEVPTQDAVFAFNNDLALGDAKLQEVTADSLGVATYFFHVAEPELTSAIRSINLKVTYGKGDSQTSIDWVHPTDFNNGEAYIVGAHQTGTDFVTAGPDKVLMVLRDPPGSNSYSYLEKGVTFTEATTYTGSVKQTGNEDFKTGVKVETIAWAGFNVGVVSKTMEIESGVTIGVKHEEQYEGQDSKTTTTTTTTRFQTSDNPMYVGAHGDLYIGNSTNITFGTTQNVSIVLKDSLHHYTGAHYNTTSNDKWALVYNEGRSISQSFNTLFAYPQVHLEERLIPQLKEGRNLILLETLQTGATKEQLQAAADATGNCYYLSLVPANDKNFGQENFYEPIFPTTNSNKSYSDTIAYLNQSIRNWENRISDNEKAKVEAELLQNYSFQSGANIEYNERYATNISHTSSFYIMVGGKVANDMYLGTVGNQTKFEFEESIETRHGGTWNSEVEAEHVKGFVLADEGIDYISVDVCREKANDEKSEEYDTNNDDLVGGDGGMVDKDDLKEKNYYPSFIFKTKGGSTSCPYEGAYVAKYYEPEKQHVLNEATMRMEIPEIDIEEKFVENVPSGETAKLTLYIRNNSETNNDMYFDLLAIDASNPDGAVFHIDGAAIGNGRTFFVPAGETLVKTLEVGKGRVLNYDNLQLVLASQCQYDLTSYNAIPNIADTVTFTVHFIPSCTNVNVRQPANNWIYNTKLNTVSVDGTDQHYMPVLINEFNVNYDNFGWIKLQYKSASQSDEAWITVMNYYNDSILYKAAIENGLNAEMIKASDAGAIRYNFMMDAMLDQRYDIRAVSVCLINNEEKENASEIRSGIKDMYNPRLFGAAQPADGVLGVEDEIRLNFNEAIAEGLLTKDNFQVRGVRNGTISDHSTSVQFDGANDFLDTEFAKNLTGKDITIETWIQPAQLQNATVFSHGNINESMELSITSDNKLQVKIGETTFTSSVLDYSPANPNYADGSWAHIALVYNAENNTVSAFYNYNEVISAAPVSTAYAGIGNVVVGKSIATDAGNYAGKMHNLRVWEKVVNPANLQLNSLTQLAGIEEGLMAYYPMSEGRGELLEDKARGATLSSHGTEWALPDGFAIQTNGSNYVKADAATFGFTNEMDYTVEFWFKAAENQINATMISVGSGEAGSMKPEYGMSIGFDADGKLAFTSSGATTAVEGEYRDNNWHHFAVSVDRTKAKGQIYIDGNLTNYIDAAIIGGITGDYIYMGARGWYSETNATNLNIDNHFNGSIDDVRFWELYKNEKMVRDNNNVKLTGEELGLVHYYPFDTYIEFQGQKYIEFTNKDLHISHTANPETDDFEIVDAGIDDIKSSIIAPLKDAGPVADLDFDFVTNNDALIITLKEQEYKITKTIVTFTVFDVRDVNGNSIISPITWSAYIDRNQVRWETDRVDIAKPAYEPYEFTVKAMNTGGAIQNYTIGNLPSWLEATPSKGTLGPVSYDIITFTINEGLNVGTYNEVIYLTNEDNVSEPLTLNITIQGEKPNWTVNPKDFKYNMSVFGKMRFNNIFSADKEDMLAAFDQNGNCIGVTTSTYNKTFDMWYALLPVYNNEKTAGGIEFRMWQASTGKTYKAEPSEAITFVNDAIVGDVDNPVIFDGKEILYRNIPLNTGWNWISFNLKDDNLSDVNRQMKNGVWTGNDQVKNANTFAAYSVNGRTWAGTLTAFNNTTMYILHSSTSQNLQVSGSAIDSKSADGKISAKKGWNYIGYIPQVNLTVKEALAGYDAQKGDIVKSQSGFAMFSRNEWVGNLSYMESGKGYMLLRTADNSTEFNYPAASAALSNRLRSAKAAPLADYRTAYADNMVVVANTTEGVLPGDRISAYINGELRGVSEYVALEDSALNFITVSGNEAGAEIQFELMRNGKLFGRANNIVPYRTNAVAGTVEQPLLLDFGTPENDVTVYPNPFKDKLQILVTAGDNDRIHLTLSDIVGKQLLQETRTAVGGSNRLEVDGASLVTGVYILQVNVNGVISTHKVTKE